MEIWCKCCVSVGSKMILTFFSIRKSSSTKTKEKKKKKKARQSVQHFLSFFPVFLSPFFAVTQLNYSGRDHSNSTKTVSGPWVSRCKGQERSQWLHTLCKEASICLCLLCVWESFASQKSQVRICRQRCWFGVWNYYLFYQNAIL